LIDFNSVQIIYRIKILIILCVIKMSNIMQAPQDDCWDQNCPLGSPPDGAAKVNCLYSKKDTICNCCKSHNMPDCQIVVPGQGIFDACSTGPNLSDLTNQKYYPSPGWSVADENNLRASLTDPNISGDSTECAVKNIVASYDNFALANTDANAHTGKILNLLVNCQSDPNWISPDLIPVVNPPSTKPKSKFPWLYVIIAIVLIVITLIALGVYASGRVKSRRY